jgi:hypothetical protein
MRRRPATRRHDGSSCCGFGFRRACPSATSHPAGTKTRQLFTANTRRRETNSRKLSSTLCRFITQEQVTTCNASASCSCRSWADSPKRLNICAATPPLWDFLKKIPRENGTRCEPDSRTSLIHSVPIEPWSVRRVSSAPAIPSVRGSDLSYGYADRSPRGRYGGGLCGAGPDSGCLRSAKRVGFAVPQMRLASREWSSRLGSPTGVSRS